MEQASSRCASAELRPMMARHQSVESDPLSNASSNPSVRTFNLTWGLLSYFGIVTLLITLAPFRFYWPNALHFVWVDGWFDAGCNVLLFVPLGFLYRLARHPYSGNDLARVFRLGLLVSAGIEITQLFLRGRYFSPTDVLTNGAGALMGAWLCDRARHFLSQRWMGRLALELPLMNIVYLLAPLIWLNGLASNGDARRAYLSWFLGFCGGLVLAGIYRYGMRRTGGVVPALFLALVAATWFVASNLPAFLLSASIPLYGCLLVGLATCGVLALPSLTESDQRRFEIPVLKQVFPLYIAYLLLLLLWPIPTRYIRWRWSLDLVELADDPGIVPILRLIESFAAFTLLGYMTAESTGRRTISQTRSLCLSSFWCGLTALTLEVCRGFHPQHIASLPQALLSLIGGVYGAIIYWLQLASIRRLLGRQSP